MRLFAALYPSQHALDAVRDTLEAVRESGVRPTMTWVPSDLLHVTTAFYGEVPGGAVDELAGRLAEAAGEAAPFDLQLRGAGVFHDRVLWLGLGGDTEALRSLSAATSGVGEEIGLRPDRRPRQRGHLTVARARQSARARPRRGTRGAASPAAAALGRCAEVLAISVGPTWTVRDLLLMESDLDADRPVHRVVETFALGGSGSVSER